jgi:hypothetical protein
VTILSPQTLRNVIELVEAGASTVETTAAIGCAPKSKIIFTWLKASADAGEFDARPVASSPWCIMHGDKLEFFHVLFEEAKTAGRFARSIRKPPIRRELEERLDAKRAGRVPMVEPSMAEQQAPPKMIIEHVTQAPVILDPPPPKPRPSYARAPAIEGVHGENGPPLEGRFTMQTQRISKAARRAGTYELTEQGVKKW